MEKVPLHLQYEDALDAYRDAQKRTRIAWQRYEKASQLHNMDENFEKIFKEKLEELESKLFEEKPEYFKD